MKRPTLLPEHQLETVVAALYAQADDAGFEGTHGANLYHAETPMLNAGFQRTPHFFARLSAETLIGMGDGQTPWY